MKRLLTDFNLPRWKNIDTDSLIPIIEKLNEGNDYSFPLILNPLYGELFHPTNEAEDHIIHQDRICISISNITLENNCLYGNVECLDNELGKQASQIFDEGGRLSIRGYTMLNNKTNKHCFKTIFTWDVVR